MRLDNAHPLLSGLIFVLLSRDTQITIYDVVFIHLIKQRRYTNHNRFVLLTEERTQHTADRQAITTFLERENRQAITPTTTYCRHAQYDDSAHLM
jgi:hypothetical protein